MFPFIKHKGQTGKNSQSEAERGLNFAPSTDLFNLLVDFYTNDKLWMYLIRASPNMWNKNTYIFLNLLIYASNWVFGNSFLITFAKKRIRYYSFNSEYFSIIEYTLQAS